MTGPGSVPGGPSAAPSGGEALPTPEKIREHFDTQVNPFVAKFARVSDREPPEGYTHWSAVPKVDLFDVRSREFGTHINVTHTGGTAGPGAPGAVTVTVSNSARQYWDELIQTYLAENAGLDASSVRDIANAAAEQGFDRVQDVFLEKDKEQLVVEIKAALLGPPPSGHDDWSSVPFNEFLDQEIEGLGEDGDTVQEVYERLVSGYVAANPELDPDETRETHSEDLKEKIFFTKQLLELRASIEENSADPDFDIAVAVDSFVESAGTSLSEDEKAEIAEELTGEIEGLQASLIESERYVRQRDAYFSDALMRVRQAEHADPDMKLEEKRDLFQEALRIYVHGGSYIDSQGRDRTFEAQGQGEESYARQLFNQYIDSHRTFDEYMRASRINHAFSGFNDEEREERAAQAYHQEQQEIAATASEVELRMYGFIAIDSVRELEAKYDVPGILSRHPELKENEAINEYLTFSGYLDSMAHHVFNNPEKDFTELRAAYNEVQTKSFGAIKILTALRRLDLEDQGLSEAQIEAELTRDAQDLSQKATYVGDQLMQFFTPDSLGDGGNKILGMYVSWHAMTLGWASLDKMGARHRDRPFARHWHTVKGVPVIPHLKRPTTWISLAFVAGEAAGLHPIGRTARLVYDGVALDFSNMDRLLDGFGSLGNLDFTQANGGLTSSGLHGLDFLQNHPLAKLAGIAGVDIPNSGEGVFRDGRIEQPDVAARFLNDKVLADLFTKAGKVLNLQREIETLRAEIAIQQQELERVQREDPTNTTEIDRLKGEIQTKTGTLQTKQNEATPLLLELFENPDNRQRIFMCLAWNQAAGFGVFGADRNEDGSMDIDKHGYMKVWAVFNTTFREAYALYPGSTGHADMQAEIDRYKSYLQEPDPKYPGQMERSQFMFDYGDVIRGDASWEDLVAKYGGTNNPFVDFGMRMEDGKHFIPGLNRKLLGDHVTAHNMAERRDLFTSTMEYIGNPAKLVGFVMLLGFIVHKSTQGNKLWKGIMWTSFPTISAISNLGARLFRAHEDESKINADGETGNANMLDQPPSNRNKLMALVFDNPNSENERVAKSEVNLIELVEEMQNSGMTIVPENNLLEELRAIQGLRHGSSLSWRDPNLMRYLQPKEFVTNGNDGRLSNLISALSNPNDGIKQIYEALKTDLASAENETEGTKVNPLAGYIEAAYQSDQKFIDIHTQMGALVALAENDEVKGVDVTIHYPAGTQPPSDTFLVRFEGDNSNDRADLASWWEQDNDKQYDRSDGAKFKARKGNSTTAFENDFQIYHGRFTSGGSRQTGFAVRYGGQDLPIDRIEVNRRLAS